MLQKTSVEGSSRFVAHLSGLWMFQNRIMLWTRDELGTFVWGKEVLTLRTVFWASFKSWTNNRPLVSQVANLRHTRNPSLLAFIWFYFSISKLLSYFGAARRERKALKVAQSHLTKRSFLSSQQDGKSWNDPKSQVPSSLAVKDILPRWTHWLYTHTPFVLVCFLNKTPDYSISFNQKL